MFVKALWVKEYKQARSLIWGMFALTFFFLPFSIIQQLSRMEQYPGSLHFSMNHPLPVLLAFLVIILGCLLIGGERTNQRDDFTFSLPYPRKTIFLTKWGLGSLAIIVSLTVNLLLAYLLLRFSDAAPNIYIAGENLWVFWLRLLFASLALYTLTLFLGTITGSYVYQAAFSVIFALFPIGFLMLAFHWLEVHGMSPHTLHFLGSYRVVEDVLINLSLFMHYLPLGAMGAWSSMICSLVYVVLFLPWGASLYEKNRVEYNGRMLVFPGMRLFFLTGIVVCFALLGGLVSTAFLGGGFGVSTMSNLVFYYIGFLILGGFSYRVADRLLHPVNG